MNNTKLASINLKMKIKNYISIPLNLISKRGTMLVELVFIINLEVHVDSTIVGLLHLVYFKQIFQLNDYL